MPLHWTSQGLDRSVEVRLWFSAVGHELNVDMCVRPAHRGPNRPPHTEAAMDDLGLMVRVFLHRFRASPAFRTISHVPTIFTEPCVFMNKHAGRILDTSTSAGTHTAWMQRDSANRWYP